MSIAEMKLNELSPVSGSPVKPFRISVVIVNHNAGAVLAECVRLVAAQAREVVVVDNGSEPGSTEKILGKLVLNGSCKLLRVPRNLGFAAGCNLGIAATSEKVVLLLNPDCLVQSGSVGHLYEVLESDPGIGMVGGFLQNLDQTEQRGARRCIPTPGRAWASGFGLVFLSRVWPGVFRDFNLNEEPLPTCPLPVEAVSGACMMIRRSALADAGGMDEGFFLHCEDLDLCLRFRNLGWKVVFDPKACVTHLQGVCGRRRPLFVEWNKHKGMVRFYKKHFRDRYPWLLYLLVCSAIGVRFSFLAPGLLLGLRGVRMDRPSNNRNKPPGFSSLCVNGNCPVTGIEEVGILGGSSFVGRHLIPLLLEKKAAVKAFSRRVRVSESPRLVWKNLESLQKMDVGVVRDWVSLCPLPGLVACLPHIAECGARRLVAVSSTSRFTKSESADPAERQFASALAQAEKAVLDWAMESGVKVVILRPTLVYDGISDKNISVVSAFIRRWRFFPVFAPASGLRQPLHVMDLAEVCDAALSSSVRTGVYNVSGGETLAYREMISRIFAWEGLPERIWEVPPWVVGLAMPALRVLPGFRGFSGAVFARMNENLVFDHHAAAEAFGFNPRKFVAPVLLESA